ncbi:MAG: peptidase A24 [Desulfobacterales bacterium C00003060]|nr:MAG: peptidase A24 [Desulfobacterales bacterium S3730MH5]OEU79423.1 MAG: peptidase A24 [Desulfobacterales bacterium C00003060]
MILEIIIFLFGMAIGSFANVCIYRLPRSLSLILPRSMCPNCKARIAFYDNVPVASYLWLRGRCRHCGTAISLRYPMVELVSGLFAVAIFMRHGLSLEGIVLYGLVEALLVITFIDIDHKIIPDVITYPGIGIGFLTSFALGYITYKESFLGIILGGGTLFLVAWGYYLVTKREGMGGGDIKLLAMIGAFLGWKGVMFTVFAGSAIGAVVGTALALRTEEGRKLAIPFGPFLSLGALLFLFFGPQIIGWYARILS